MMLIEGSGIVHRDVRIVYNFMYVCLSVCVGVCLWPISCERMKSVRLFCFLLIPVFVWFSSPVSARIYQYRDKDGVVHFTDRLSDIPQDQLPEVRPLGKKEKHPISEGPKNIPGRKDEAPGKDRAAAKEKGDGSDQDREIPIVKKLNREKAALDAEHAKLVKKKKTLKIERSTLKTPEEVRGYQKKVKELNKRINAYKKRNRAFQKEVDAYNSALKEEEEK